MAKKKISKYNIFRLLCLIAYIGCTGVLIVESAMDGKSSANQSNQVGGAIADTINGIQGDQTVAVLPTSLTITNKISEAKVGDTHKLLTETLPTDATYKSVIFASNNESVASIGDDGTISFLKQGSVTFTATNKKYPSLTDSLTVEVSNVEATSITSTIHDLTPSENIYTLYLGKEYHIDTYFTPENTTIKNLNYSYDSSFLSIDADGIITPKKYSANATTKITVQHELLVNELDVKIEYESIEKLESLDISLTETSIAVGQSVSPKITINPSNATFKDYTITSSDSSIAKIASNKIQGVKEGTATITVASKTYPDISDSIEVSITPKPELTDFTPSLSKTIIVGKTAKVSYKKTPSYAKDPTSVTYSSDNESIATVSNKGVVTGISEGSTKINITINGITKSCPISIIPVPAQLETEDFSLSTLKTNLTYGVTYNLSEIVTLNKWIPVAPTDTTLLYELSDLEYGDIVNDTITLDKLGSVNLNVTHPQTSKTHSVTLTCKTYDFALLDENDTPFGDHALTVGQKISFKISDNQNPDNIIQTYLAETDHDDIVTISQDENGYYVLEALKDGEAHITVSSYIDGESDGNQKTFTISSTHVYTDLLEYHLLNNDTHEELHVSNNSVDVEMNTNYSITPVVSNQTTISQIRYKSSDESVATIESNGDIKLLKAGTTIVRVTEELTQLEKKFTLKVFNHIELSSENSYLLTGVTEVGNKSYSIVNGTSGKFEVVFSEKSTFTEVKYFSSNESIATIGQDGVITPLKAGKTTLTAIIDDGMLEDDLRITIELEVKRQDFITDLKSFFYQVRKGLGHFSAFLVLGIFSSLTWLLYFNDKKLFYSVPGNFVSGFAIAALTEYIQTLVPGRYGCWADIWLDFEGFMLSALLISIGVIIFTLIKNHKKKKQPLAPVSTNEQVLPSNTKEETKKELPTKKGKKKNNEISIHVLKAKKKKKKK